MLKQCNRRWIMSVEERSANGYSAGCSVFMMDEACFTRNGILDTRNQHTLAHETFKKHDSNSSLQ
jgi:hypothetical protein